MASAGLDSLYDEFNQKMDLIRADMLEQVHESASAVIRNQPSVPFGFSTNCNGNCCCT